MTPSNRTGSATAFILSYRRLAKGVKGTVALALAKEKYPADYREYVAAQTRGEMLPPLDRRPDYEIRLARAIQTGRIN